MKKVKSEKLKFSKPITLITVMIIVNMIVLSFCTSYSRFYFTYNKDRNCGFLSNQRIINVVSKEKDIDVDRVLSICNEDTDIDEIMVSGFLYNKIDEVKGKIWMIPIVLVDMNDNSLWQPLINSGMFFSKNEMDSIENLAVIGNSLIKNNLNNADQMQVYDESFKVIGDVGNDSYNSDYNSAIFLPINKLPEELKSNVRSMYIRIYSNKNLDKKKSEIEKKLKYAPQITVGEEMSGDYITFYKYLGNAIIVAAVITIILLVNIIVIFYFNKKVYKKVILQLNILQALKLCIICVVMTLIIHMGIYNMISNNKINELYSYLFKVTYINIIQSFITFIVIYILMRKVSIKVFGDNIGS